VGNWAPTAALDRLGAISTQRSKGGEKRVNLRPWPVSILASGKERKREVTLPIPGQRRIVENWPEKLRSLNYVICPSFFGDSPLFLPQGRITESGKHFSTCTNDTGE